MKTTVLRKMQYENTFIYVLQYEYTFQYLFAWENEVCRHEFVFEPVWWKRIAFRLHLMSIPYNERELSTGEQIILVSAMDSIDLLKQPGAKQARAEAEEVATQKRELGARCVWQARKEKEEIYWYCLTHDKEVAKRNGVALKHD